jgi:hypothetical protein
VPREISLDQVTSAKDHRHELERRLLCVKCTSSSWAAPARAVPGQLHDGKMRRIPAGQRCKSNRIAGSGKHRHHKRSIMCSWRMKELYSKRPTTRVAPTAHSTPTQKAPGALPTFLSMKQRSKQLLSKWKRISTLDLGGRGYLAGNTRRGDGQPIPAGALACCEVSARKPTWAHAAQGVVVSVMMTAASCCCMQHQRRSTLERRQFQQQPP